MEEEDGEVETLEEGGGVEGVVGGRHPRVGCVGGHGIIVIIVRAGAGVWSSAECVVAAEERCEKGDGEGPTNENARLVEGGVDRVELAVGREGCVFERKEEGRGDGQVDGVLGDVH